MTYGPEDLTRLVGDLLYTCGPARTYALSGELGAGKTTLVTEFCRQLGVTEPVSSPTYSLVNEYSGREGAVFHLDAYRLESVEEALAAGLEDLFAENEGATFFVEWPAVIAPLLGEDVVHLRLAHVAGRPDRRTLTVGEKI